MTDRELLGLAAKAEGREIEWMAMYIEGREPETFSARWNPLTNDGDALRLAVKLGLMIGVHLDETWVQSYGTPKDKWLTIKEPHDGDAYAATRRAIVRAAAEIGKEMS
jgi:hypothetical protein